MKKRNIQTFFVAAGLLLSLGACKKETENIFNMFDDVSITFHGDDPQNIVDYKVVNEGEEVIIDYTITSAEKDMYAIVVAEAKKGDNRPILTTPIPDNADKRTYSGTYTVKADRAGKATYRIYALDSKGIYMGDGYKSVTIDVVPGFTFFSQRKVYIPDSTAGVAPSFYSINKGEAYSYTNGKANSANIDFGIYRVPFTTSAGNLDYKYHLYSISAPQNPFTVYNVSDWTKRGTKFSAPQTGKTSLFNNTLVTGLTIEAEAKKVSINLLATTTDLPAQSVVFFLTPEGKYGAIYIHERTQELDGRPYIAISVKVQK